MNKFDEKFKLLEVASFETPGAINKYNRLVLLVSDIYGRLSALENIIACDGIDARLHQPSAQPATNTVIESLNKAKERIAKYNSDDRLAEIIEQIKSEYSVEKPAETEREWIPIEGQRFWISWDNQDGGVILAEYYKGEFSSETVFEFNNPTHIMPYRPGDPKPEPPVDNELRGALHDG